MAFLDCLPLSVMLEGNPLQYFAWRTPGTEEPGGLVYEIAQSWTRLKRLSSSAAVEGFSVFSNG